MKNIDRREFIGKSVLGAAGISFGVNAFADTLTAENKPQEPNRSAQKQVEYGEAVRKKYPEQCIVAIAKDKNGKANPITMGWTMITSDSPPMMAVSMSAGSYTVEAVSFTITYPSAEQADAVLFFGTHSGRNTDKFKEFPTAIEPAKQIDSVLLTDAVANFECQLESEFTTGDHFIFVGRLVASHVNVMPKKRLFILGPGRKLGPV